MLRVLPSDPWCAASEPAGDSGPGTVKPAHRPRTVGKERKPGLQALSKEARAGRACLKGSRSLKAFAGKTRLRGVMAWVICSGAFSWLAGGDVIGSRFITF